MPASTRSKWAGGSALATAIGSGAERALVLAISSAAANAAAAAMARTLVRLMSRKTGPVAKKLRDREST